MSRVARDMVTSPQVLARIKTDIVAAVKATETVARTVAVWNSGTPALGGGVGALLVASADVDITPSLGARAVPGARRRRRRMRRQIDE